MSGPQDLSIRPAAPGDRSGILGLLAEAGLPSDHVEADLERFRVACAGGEVVGSIALYAMGSVGWVRSLAVRPLSRRHGVGRALCERVSAEAAALGFEALCLLTIDAAAFFERLGFVRLPRSAAPAEVAGARWYAEHCPAAAVLMRREVRPA